MCSYSTHWFKFITSALFDVLFGVLWCTSLPDSEKWFPKHNDADVLLLIFELNFIKAWKGYTKLDLWL